MQLALDEANRGRTRPNPRVGAIVVRDGAVVSTGYHRAAGEAHAEVDAIRNAGGPVTGATLYVTLEPCNHRGRTGPCTEAIRAAGIARVVIGCADPADHGIHGAEALRAAGIDVEAGVMEEEAHALIADFAKHVHTGLPLVTIKAAITLDGKLATRTGDSKWITGMPARTETHRMRDDADAIMVGVGTVLADDPQLTVRHTTGRDPVRVVLDSALRTPLDARILNLSGESPAPTWIFHAIDAPLEKKRNLEAAGAELFPVPRDDAGVDLEAALGLLGQRDILRLMVEGGAHVHGSFLDRGLADRAAVFIAPRIMGDAEAMSFAIGPAVDTVRDAARLTRTHTRRLGDDFLITGDFERTN